MCVCVGGWGGGGHFCVWFTDCIYRKRADLIMKWQSPRSLWFLRPLSDLFLKQSLYWVIIWAFFYPHVPDLFVAGWQIASQPKSMSRPLLQSTVQSPWNRFVFFCIHRRNYSFVLSWYWHQTNTWVIQQIFFLYIKKKKSYLMMNKRHTLSHGLCES